MINEFVLTSGALVRINDAGREHGQIRAFNGAAYDLARNLPTVVLRNEDYGRITRILADGTPVELEFTISEPDLSRWQDVVQRHRRDSGHRQGRRSRHARRPPRLMALGDRRDGQRDRLRGDDGSRAHPAGDRRQAAADDSRRALGRRGAGPAGSRAYVEQHFGTAENPKPEFAKFNGYFNVDGGTGPDSRRDRSSGRRRRRRSCGQYFKQFEDLGVYGAIEHDQPRDRRHRQHVVQHRRPAGDRPGPGHDRVHSAHVAHQPRHIERIVEEDVKKSAVAIASAVYHVAMREQMLPRFAPDQMPAPPAPAGRGGGAPTPSQR